MLLGISTIRRVMVLYTSAGFTRYGIKALFAAAHAVVSSHNVDQCIPMSHTTLESANTAAGERKEKSAAMLLVMRTTNSPGGYWWIDAKKSKSTGKG